MPVPNIVRGQRISRDKLELAKQFRAEMTPAEQDLWQRLRGERLAGFHFRRQQIIDGFVVDLYCHQAAVVVEIDGGVHQQLQQAEYDVERQRLLEAKGLIVLRFSNERVLYNPDAVLTEIEQCCRRRCGMT